MKLHSVQSSALALLAAIAIAAPGLAIDITAGDVVVQNLGSYGFTSNNSILSYDSGGTDELYQMFGYLGNANGVVRVAPNDFNVVSAITATANIATSTVSIDANGAAVLGLASGDVEIDYTFTLIDDTGPADADHFAWSAGIRNASTATLDLVFYSYLDLDLAGLAASGRRRTRQDPVPGEA